MSNPNSTKPSSEPLIIENISSFFRDSISVLQQTGLGNTVILLNVDTQQMRISFFTAICHMCSKLATRNIHRNFWIYIRGRYAGSFLSCMVNLGPSLYYIEESSVTFLIPFSRLFLRC
jgi:hypothetical protein